MTRHVTTWIGRRSALAIVVLLSVTLSLPSAAGADAGAPVGPAPAAPGAGGGASGEPASPRCPAASPNPGGAPNCGHPPAPEPPPPPPPCAGTFSQEAYAAYVAAGGPDGVLFPDDEWSFGGPLFTIMENVGLLQTLPPEAIRVLHEAMCVVDLAVKQETHERTDGPCAQTQAAITYQDYQNLGSPGGVLVEPDNRVLYPVASSIIFDAFARAGLSAVAEQHRETIEGSLVALTCLVALTGQPESL